MSPLATRKRLIGPLRSSSSIQEKVRTSTLIHSGSRTQAKTTPRHVRESRVKREGHREGDDECHHA